MAGYVQSSHGKAEKQAGEVAQSVILGLSSIFRTIFKRSGVVAQLVILVLWG